MRNGSSRNVVLEAQCSLFVQDKDSPKFNGVQALMLDKRTVTRILDRGVATGELQHVCVHVPAHGETQAEAIYVVLAKGIDIEGDPSLVRRVSFTTSGSA